MLNVQPKEMAGPALTDKPCRYVDNYEQLNFIDEGTYGVVYRARDKHDGKIYALKQIKTPTEKNGFPISGLREITTLLSTPKHENLVDLKEVVISKKHDRFYLVMQYIDHDLLSLVEKMKQPYTPSEVKSLVLQLLNGIAHLHKHSVIHRDLKLSNLLLTQGGQLKIADFGLARSNYFKSSSSSGSAEASSSSASNSDINQKFTKGVATLWYRAPEILMGSENYSFPIDMWAIGCIFAELILQKPLLNGQTELDQLNKTAHLLGAPSNQRWSGFSDLPHAKRLNFKHAPEHSSLVERLTSASSSPSSNQSSSQYTLTKHTIDLIVRMLEYDPNKRITASQALSHPYFSEMPPPKHPSLIQTFPSRSS